MLKLKQEFKNEIENILKLYKEGEVYTYFANNKENFLNQVKPYFHENKKIGNIRRIRFIICSENSWNRINLSDAQHKNIIDKCKEILNKYEIGYEHIRLTSYYPYMECRMEYASWNKCLEIVCQA